MEILEEVVSAENVLVLNEQPEFIENFNEKINARYFVICENNNNDSLPKNVFECSVCGLTLAEWVVRACPSEPVVLRANEGEDVLRLIKPYISGIEYSVVLYASTPFVRKGHLLDLLGFVSRKHLSACKLKKGYVFKNDYISRVDRLFSIDTYDFASDDFFEVKDIRDLEYAQLILKRRVLDFHNKNQVILDGRNLTIDASVEIGYHTEIGGGSAIISKTKIGADSKIGANAVICGSKLGDDVVVENGAIIEDSVIKDGAFIGAGSVIKKSVIGERSNVESATVVSCSGLKQNVFVGTGATLIGARVAENAQIKAAAKVVMANEMAAVLANAVVGEGAMVCDTIVSENAIVKPFAKLTKNYEEKK